MRNLLLIIMMLAASTGIQAQNRDIPALVITLKDGSKDTIMDEEVSMYGVEIPTGDDFISAGFRYKTSYYMWTLPLYMNITDYGKEGAWYGKNSGWCGFLISDYHITDFSVPLDKYNYTWDPATDYYICLLGDNTEKWIYAHPFSNHANFNLQDTLLTPGTTYYCRGYYILDGKTFLTKETEMRIDKTISNVINYNRLHITYGADIPIVFTGATDIYAKLTEKYGESRCLLYDLINKKVNAYAASLTEEQVKAMADSTEVCDDGSIYFINIPDNIVEEVIAQIEKEANEPFYVPANMETLLPYGNDKAAFVNFCPTEAYFPRLITCDPKWGIKDNQYVTTFLPTANTFAATTLGIRLNHVMMPGKAYDITFSIAPQTDESITDELPLNCYVVMADGQDQDLEEDTYKPLPNGSSTWLSRNAMENVDGSGRIFVAPSDAVSTFTVRYTPQTLVYSHAFKIMHTVNSFTTSARRKQSQYIRLIGVDVKPAE
ncbi:MAG: hypothetical protein Q4E63_02470 [Prevotellaceae bacterium]|nr:hypothetical protein [Prevotellaceae bacterium]MDO4931508.1 hypothetical protein [Prevotellaceae bacterium]